MIHTTKLARHGVAAAPGLAVGTVFVHAPAHTRAAHRKISATEVELEVSRAQAGFAAASVSLQDLAQRAPDAAAVLEAHRLMLQDPMITTAVERFIRHDLRCAEWAIDSMAHEIGGRFATLGDAYFRDRGQDLDVVAARVLQELHDQDSGGPSRQSLHWSAVVPAGVVVVAHDLSPGDVILLAKRGVAALITEVGGATSHTAILARALALPAVVGVGDVTIDVHANDLVLVDGYQGRITLRPSDDDCVRFELRRKAAASVEAALQAEVNLPAMTLDGVELPLMANVELPEEVEAACRLGAVGVGLYRSEFLFLNRRDIPSVSDHREASTSILTALDHRSRRHAVFRTFDLGSDKLSAALRVGKESNPALGLRGVRLGLKRLPALRDQLEGTLRAHAGLAEARLLLPMIGSVEEVLAVRRELEDVLGRLRAEGLVLPTPLLGVMIELPVAVWIADALAEVADFFSVGTNDLVQYELGVDRGNEHVAHLYRPLHPGVLRALHHVVQAAHTAGIPASLCGEVAADPTWLPLLLGLGFDSISMPAPALQRVRYVLRRLRADEAQLLVKRCLRCKTAAAVEAELAGAFVRLSEEDHVVLWGQSAPS